jgi:hypothetical protein
MEGLFTVESKVILYNLRICNPLPSSTTAVFAFMRRKLTLELTISGGGAPRAAANPL